MFIMKRLLPWLAQTSDFKDMGNRTRLARTIRGLLWIALFASNLHGGELEKAAIKELNQLIQTKPDDAEVYLKRGELYREDSEYRLALKDFNMAERLNRNLSAIEFARARVYNDINRHELTEEHLLRFLGLEPANRKALRLLATHYIDREQYREADQVYGRIIETFETPTLSFYFLRSQNRESYGDIEGALALIEEAIRLSQWTPMLEIKAVEYEMKLDNHQAAFERLDRLIEKEDRRRFRYYQKKAEVLLVIGDVAQAKANYKHALNSLDERHPRLSHLPGLKALREDLLESIAALDR